MANTEDHAPITRALVERALANLDHLIAVHADLREEQDAIRAALVALLEILAIAEADAETADGRPSSEPTPDTSSEAPPSTTA